MTLKDLLEGVDIYGKHLYPDTDIKGIAYDSRKVREGFVFVCIKGFVTDGHKYIRNAVENGATVIVAEDDCDACGALLIRTENTRKALAAMASNFYGNPKDKMKIIGVTGTNGKTTSTSLIKHVLDFMGKKTGLIGTNANMIGDIVLDAERTTPESLELHELFAKMVNAGVEYVIMEVSSHSLDLFRVWGIEFEVGIFTNLTQDHLDFHETMDNYLAAKKKLFEMSKVSVINADDEYGRKIIDSFGGKTVTYAIENEADFKADNIKVSPKGVLFDVYTESGKQGLRLGIPGKFSVYNALSVYAALISLSINASTISEALIVAKGVKGRAETVYTRTDYTVIIDYAHTPDGLENIIRTVKDFTEGRVITLFGCGGDRDNSKRSIMGQIAGELSDYCIITSDNPRTEEPMTIIRQIEEGMKKTNCKYTVIENRKKAIGYALSIAKADDCIILAGKGHETYQILGKEKIHFDEREVVWEFLNLK
ncbi:MAG: UDP-N-acetylmuramoyl-L-alanyl-D-glutamate--2,6-diaminopimelate ligase [Ruminococcaceae bacterium]|nr:UDP-N-acetylmuramoyl-L-alanyl-D-glutamate--2,6-diaminopimelate ligase [Oscillospiraceae bacterium]